MGFSAVQEDYDEEDPLTSVFRDLAKEQVTIAVETAIDDTISDAGSANNSAIDAVEADPSDVPVPIAQLRARLNGYGSKSGAGIDLGSALPKFWLADVIRETKRLQKQLEVQDAIVIQQTQRTTEGGAALTPRGEHTVDKFESLRMALRAAAEWNELASGDGHVSDSDDDEPPSQAHGKAQARAKPAVAEDSDSDDELPPLDAGTGAEGEVLDVDEELGGEDESGEASLRAFRQGLERYQARKAETELLLNSARSFAIAQGKHPVMARIAGVACLAVW